MPAPKPTTVSSEMKNKVWNVSLKTFVLKGLLKKFRGRDLCVGLVVTVCFWWFGVLKMCLSKSCMIKQELGCVKARLVRGGGGG